MGSAVRLHLLHVGPGWGWRPGGQEAGGSQWPGLDDPTLSEPGLWQGWAGAVPAGVLWQPRDGAQWTEPASAVEADAAEAASASPGPGGHRDGHRTPSVCWPVSPVVTSCTPGVSAEMATGQPASREQPAGGGAGGVLGPAVAAVGVSNTGVCVRWTLAGVEAGPGRRARIWEASGEGTSGRTPADLRVVRAGSQAQGEAQQLAGRSTWA